MEYILPTFLIWGIGGFLTFVYCLADGISEYNNKKQLFFIAFLCGPFSLFCNILWLIWYYLGDKK